LAHILQLAVAVAVGLVSALLQADQAVAVAVILEQQAQRGLLGKEILVVMQSLVQAVVVVAQVLRVRVERQVQD
jgi:hypothetical protein